MLGNSGELFPAKGLDDVTSSDGTVDVAATPGDGEPASSTLINNLAGRLSSIGQAVLAFGQGDARFREVIDALPAAIYTTDKAGRITFYNEAAEANVGPQPDTR